MLLKKKKKHVLELTKQRDTGTSVFIAVLFPTAKTWKQRKYPSTDEYIKKMWYIYMCVCVCVHNGVLLGHKKKEIPLFVTTWMDLPY